LGSGPQSLISQEHSGIGYNNLDVYIDPPRTLTPDQKTELTDSLEKEKEVVITSLFGDSESIQFAQQIYDFLKAEGYQVTGVMRSVFNAPVRGVDVEFEKGKYQLTVGSKY
jgi:hypothetical protein